jgi:predicted metalloendopeptidase
LLAQTLEKLSSADAKRTANEQEVGDYYFACIDEAGIAAHTKEWVKELDRIGAIRSKRELAAKVARLHQSLPAAWSANDNQTNAALFGFSGSADFNDASRKCAADRSGRDGPAGSGLFRDQDDRSKEIRANYRQQLENMFGLAGEPEAAGRCGLGARN